MRPHVELIDEKDLIFHPSELVGGIGEAKQRNLAYDEEDGSLSAKIHFDSDWRRPAGVHVAQTEWYVLEGEVKIGDEVLHKGSYWMTPAGVVAPALEVKAGTQILYFREFGDWRFEATDQPWDSVRPDQKLIIKRSEEMDWIDVSTAARCASTWAAPRCRACTSRCCFATRRPASTPA